MIQGGGRARLGDESRLGVGIGAERGREKLQGDLTSEPLVRAR